jgi:hypothetical protein
MMMRLFLPIIIVVTVLVSKASAAEDIDIRATLDVSRLKGARVRYYPFDLERPTKASVPLPSLVFRGEKNLIEKCRPFILERLVYPVLLKSKYAVAAFDFRIARGSLEHRIYWIPGGIHEGRALLEDCSKIDKSDYLEYLRCQEDDCN